MAKAPRPGKVKTRLSPPLTPEQAAALNVCFIRDTADNLQQVTEASNSYGIIAYTPLRDEDAFDDLLPSYNVETPSVNGCSTPARICLPVASVRFA